jgi:hypothetical protein
MPNFDFDEGFNPSQIKLIKILGPLHLSLKNHKRTAIDISGSNCDYDLRDEILTIKPTSSPLGVAPNQISQALENKQIVIPPTLRLNAPEGTQIQLLIQLNGEIMTTIP